MRSEQEMLELIVGTAAADDRIRAVVLNGSRASLTAASNQFVITLMYVTGGSGEAGVV